MSTCRRRCHGTEVAAGTAGIHTQPAYLSLSTVTLDPQVYNELITFPANCRTCATVSECRGISCRSMSRTIRCRDGVKLESRTQG
jgi:hypothetical protein